MRQARLLAVVLLLCGSSSLFALQIPPHINALEPAIKSELQVPTDVILGTCILKAGTYLIECDRANVTFTLKSTEELIVTMPCKGRLMKDKAKETRADYEKQPSGYIVLERLYLKGSNVEHVF